MNEYKIKIRDTAKVEKLQEESYQIPILQTREELIDFLIRNKAYPYYSKTGKIFFRRLKKAEDENTIFEGIIKNGAVEKLGLQTEEDCNVLRHEGLLQSFLFYQSKNIFADEDSMGSGSIFNAITKEDMSNIKILIPNKSLDRKFNELVGSMDKQIENLQSQTENLKNTRDLLLPKLILGEIDMEKLDINTEELEQ